MEKFFKLKEHGTNVRTELIAGLTTFMTMAYILAVNPNILSAAGMDSGAVFTATAVASAIATLCMGLLANLPFALSAGMGLNAYLAYTVVIGMGYSWQTALAAVFVEGIIFIILSLTKVREAIFNLIPTTLKKAVAVGIGLFIAFIGLQNAGIAVDSATLVSMFSFSSSVKDGTFFTSGICALLALIGVIVTAILVVRGIKGNILIGIFVTWILGMICQGIGLYRPDNEAFFSVFPSGIVSLPASMAPTFLQMDFTHLLSLQFAVIVFSFLFVDVFDTMGTLIGAAMKGNMLDKDGKLPGIRGALMADSIGTVVGAGCGTSTITTFVESTAGIMEGGRTGLTAITTAVLFALSLFFSPLFLAIPSFATAPALIIVGFMMMQNVGEISWKDPTESIPAFITIGAMPFFYSISEGISLGIISYVIINLVTGNRKKVNIPLIVLAVIFLIKYWVI